MSTLIAAPVTEICYVTHDMHGAMSRWAEGLRAGPFYTMTMPVGFGARTYRGRPATDSFSAALGFCGTTLLEFIQPLDDEPSVFREVLDRRGDMAVHHIFPNIQQMDAAQFDLEDARYRRAGYVPALVADIPGLGRNVLYDASGQLGVFVELLEVSPAMYAGLEKMFAAHRHWDGQRPVRDFMESMH